MIDWVDSHGILMMFTCFVFATVMSSAPKDTPSYWGFWRTWCFNAFQALGASAGNYAKTSPLFQKVSSTEVTLDAQGNRIQTDTAASKSTQLSPAVPASSPTTNVPPPPAPVKAQGVFP